MAVYFAMQSSIGWMTPGEAVRAGADYLVLPSKMTGGNDVRAAWHPTILAERSNIAPAHRQMIAPPSFDQSVTTRRIVAFADSVSLVLMTFAPHLACYAPWCLQTRRGPTMKRTLVVLQLSRAIDRQPGPAARPLALLSRTL